MRLRRRSKAERWQQQTADVPFVVWAGLAAVLVGALAALAYTSRRRLFAAVAVVASAVEEVADTVEDAAEDLRDAARERATATAD